MKARFESSEETVSTKISFCHRLVKCIGTSISQLQNLPLQQFTKRYQAICCLYVFFCVDLARALQEKKIKPVQISSNSGQFFSPKSNNHQGLLIEAIEFAILSIPMLEKSTSFAQNNIVLLYKMLLEHEGLCLIWYYNEKRFEEVISTICISASELWQELLYDEKVMDALLDYNSNYTTRLIELSCPESVAFNECGQIEGIGPVLPENEFEFKQATIARLEQRISEFQLYIETIFMDQLSEFDPSMQIIFERACRLCKLLHLEKPLLENIKQNMNHPVLESNTCKPMK